MLSFSNTGPFDRREQELIEALITRLGASAATQREELVRAIGHGAQQLQRLAAILDGYPPVSSQQSLGSERRDLMSLVGGLTRATAANIEMFLPARALVSRTLVMGEVNFYRLLRIVCLTALPQIDRDELLPQVDELLVGTLYTRLTETVLISIASDNSLPEQLRNRAGLGLSQMWDDPTYQVSAFFPVLEATWDARRQVPATLGTLLGTAEMFGLIRAGCDDRFVDYLARPDHSEDEADAFREFLFGTTTEQLAHLQEQMLRRGLSVISSEAAAESAALAEPHTTDGDPALAMFEFFLSRHLGASARRHANVPGPKRTAEEYVMLHHLSSLGLADS